VGELRLFLFLLEKEMMTEDKKIPDEKASAFLILTTRRH
jgi:hypothetical protein